MSTPLQSRGFQTYNKLNSIPRSPPTKKASSITIDESTAFGRMPYASSRTSTGTVPSSPTSIAKPSPMTPKRRSSTISLGILLSRRKSLQTTALATRRQSLWMNIAKNAPPSANDTQPLPFLLGQDPASLTRKKILRVLLVISYLLSISVLAIVLATFYGFFWSGYSTPEITTILDIKTNVPSLISSPSNSTVGNHTSEIEDNLLVKSIP